MSHQLGTYVRTAPPSWMGKKGRAHWNKQKDREEASHNKKCALLDAGVAYEDLDDVMRPKPKWPLSSYGTLTSWTDEPAPKTEEQLVAERVEKYMEGWPWIKNGGISPKDWKKLILVAPFKYRESSGTAKREYHAQDQSPFMSKLFRQSPFETIILEYLWDCHDAAWKLSATCQEAFELANWGCDHWDMTAGDFRLTEFPSSGPGSLKGHLNQGSVATNLIISPQRKPRTARYFRGSRNDPNDNLIPDGGRIPYQRQIQHIHQLCISVYNYGKFFKNVQMHRVPLLTTQVLELIIPCMPGLEKLGIYNCQLLHIGSTVKILDILRMDRPRGRENQISLDYFPNFHQGPADTSDSPYAIGPYGATWDNWNADTCIAIWALICRIIGRARWQGIDFESRHTAFRRWLDKSPCYMVEETLEAMFNVDTPVRKVAMMVDWRHTQGRSNFHCTRADYPKNFDWCTKPIHCGTCNEDLLGIFFDYGQIKNIKDYDLPDAPKCMGCKLNSHLEAEIDHYKGNKRRDIIEKWLYEPETGEWNTADLHKAIDQDFFVNRVSAWAKAIDRMRAADMAKPGGYDHEYDERQKPYEKKERGKRGGFLRSPLCKQDLNWWGHRYDDHLPKHY